MPTGGPSGSPQPGTPQTHIHMQPQPVAGTDVSDGIQRVEGAQDSGATRGTHKEGLRALGENREGLGVLGGAGGIEGGRRQGEHRESKVARTVAQRRSSMSWVGDICSGFGRGWGGMWEGLMGICRGSQGVWGGPGEA